MSFAPPDNRVDVFMAGSSSQCPRGLRCRWISRILVAVFTLQLYALTWHSHAPSAYASDCAACAADGMPSLYAEVTPIVLLIWRLPSAYLVLLALVSSPCLRRSFLIPCAHGPPAPFFFRQVVCAGR